MTSTQLFLRHQRHDNAGVSTLNRSVGTGDVAVLRLSQHRSPPTVGVTAFRSEAGRMQVVSAASFVPQGMLVNRFRSRAAITCLPTSHNVIALNVDSVWSTSITG